MVRKVTVESLAGLEEVFPEEGGLSLDMGNPHLMTSSPIPSQESLKSQAWGVEEESPTLTQRVSEGTILPFSCSMPTSSGPSPQ